MESVEKGAGVQVQLDSERIVLQPEVPVSVQIPALPLGAFVGVLKQAGLIE